MTRSLSIFLALALLLLAAEAPAQVPSSPLGQRVTALLDAIAAGNEPATKSFFQEHVEAGFRDEFPMSQHVEMFGRMHRALGRPQVVSYEQTSPTEARVVVRSGRGEERRQLEVEIAPGPPHRIVGIGIAIPGEGSAPAPAAPAPDRLDAAARRAVVDSVAALFPRHLLFPDTGRMIADRLRGRLAAGAYDRLDTPQTLAEALTADIRAVNPDRHLNVRAGSGPGMRPVESGAMIERAERLPGNVGYLDLSIIGGSPQAFREMEDALRTLGDTDAMILDLRGVPGGSAEMANFIVSHFLPPEVHTVTVVTPAQGDTALRRTLADVPGPRRLEVPLYVLIDGRSGSAAEHIPFVLQNLKRATLVGERTAGAGRNNRVIPVGYGMAASISYTRVYDPATGREWERVGVAPDVDARSADALQAALREIARRTTDPARRAALQQAAEGAGSAGSQKDLAGTLRQVREEGSIPALAAAVVRGDGIVAAAAVGVRRQGAPGEVTAGDRFAIGSLTKQLTGALIGRLVEEGKLRWDATLADLLPDLREEMDPAYRTATLEQLLQHRAGIAPFTRLGPEQARLFQSFTGDDAAQRRQFAAHLLRLPPTVAPGTGMVYSNAGYGLAGAIAERAMGRPWEELMREYVFHPLGMTTAAFGYPFELGADQPVGHVGQGGSFTPIGDGFPRARAALRPAGGVSMSIEDLARFARAHLQALAGTPALLRPETARRLYGDKPATLAGGNGAYTAIMDLRPQEGMAIVVATNSGAEEALAGLVRRLREEYAAPAR